jgi:hypothetical protein
LEDQVDDSLAVELAGLAEDRLVTVVPLARFVGIGVNLR